MGASESKRLGQLTEAETNVVPCHNEMIKAKIFDIHDGDTVKVGILYGKKSLKFSIRLEGIDAPEISRCPDWEKEAGLKVRDYLVRMIQNGSKNNIVTIKLTSPDKYGGRYVGNIYLRGQPVTRDLLNHGYVKPYDGNKKTPFTQAECREIVRYLSR